MNEKETLDAIQANSLYAAGVNANTVEYSFRVFKRYIMDGNILEMGPAEGIMTDLLVPLGHDVTVVEGAKGFCDELKLRHPTVSVNQCLIEEYEPDQKFDNIILGHVLEHVKDPVAILEKVKGWVTSNGRILAAVPNSRSLHRQAAVMMGLLSFEQQLNEADRHHGHRRVYNPETFRQDFLAAGFQIEVFGGYWLKPVSNSQIEHDWTAEMLRAFMELGERYPDIAAEIYIVATD